MKDLTRRLLRETAQSVVVVTAALPGSRAAAPVYHGATLSSFASVALDPSPLVAFSLRIPSRMATALNAHVTSPSPAPHFVVNILSAAQSHVAHRFARPDIHPHPFADPHDVPWSLSHEGLPILSGALGALSCGLVGPSLSLAHWCASGRFAQHSCEPEHPHQLERNMDSEAHHASGGGLASELFIARVLRVERVPKSEPDEQEDAGLYKLPLLYHRRRYATVRDCDILSQEVRER